METNVNYTLVGLFVIAASIALIGAILWLASGTQDRTFVMYKVYLRESVAGLNEGAAVRYRGVDVGSVESISLDPADPRQVELILNIVENTPVREDTLATLTTQGLTGLASVELSGGSPKAAALQPVAEGELPVIGSRPSLVKRLDDAFTDAVIEFEHLSDRLDRVLSAENTIAFGTILTNLSTVSDVLGRRTQSLDNTLTHIESLTANLAANGPQFDLAIAAAVDTLEQSAQASAALSPTLERVAAGAVAVDSMAKTITETSDRLNIAVAESQRDVRRLLQRTTPEINALLGELERLTNTVQRFVDELDRNPQMLLLGKPAPPAGPGE